MKRTIVTTVTACFAILPLLHVSDARAQIINGSFETGDFTGWITFSSGFSTRSWEVSGSGQGGGPGMATTQPQDGEFVAWNGFDGLGPMEFEMYQLLKLPATVANLNWMDRVQWNFNFGDTATLPRLYDVEIRSLATLELLQNLYSFSTGTQATNPTGNTNWQSHSVDISSFAGQNVLLVFREQIPQFATGPAQIEFDAISLDTGTIPEPSVIPEPSTMAIWSLLGALGITVGWWRKRRAA